MPARTVLCIEVKQVDTLCKEIGLDVLMQSS